MLLTRRLVAVNDSTISEEREKTRSMIVIASSAAGWIVSLSYALSSHGGVPFGMRALMWFGYSWLWIAILIASYFFRNKMYYLLLGIISGGYSVIFFEALFFEGMHNHILMYFGVGAVIVALTADHLEVNLTCVVGCILTSIVGYYRHVDSLALFNFLIVQIFLSSLAHIFIYFEKRYLERLQIEKENVEALLRVLNHDINNAVFVISGTAQLMQSHKNAGEGHLDRIVRASDKIIRICENSRKMLALKSTKMAINKETVDLHAVCKEVLTDFESQAREKDISLELMCSGEGSSFLVLGEKHIISDNILMNMLTNAIKFTSANGRIVIFLEREKDKVVVRISDNGIGIPKSLLPNLFNKYTATSRAGVRGEKGTGFGLPNVKFFLNKMGGQIYLRSRSKDDGHTETGTEFTLVFPASAGDNLLKVQ